MNTFQSLDELFGLEPRDWENIPLTQNGNPAEVYAYDYARLVEWDSIPENRKFRGEQISKGKKGNKVRPMSDEGKANIAAAVKKRWAEGTFKRKHQPRDPETGLFLKLGSKK